MTLPLGLFARSAEAVADEADSAAVEFIAAPVDGDVGIDTERGEIADIGVLAPIVDMAVNDFC